MPPSPLWDSSIEAIIRPVEVAGESRGEEKRRDHFMFLADKITTKAEYRQLVQLPPGKPERRVALLVFHDGHPDSVFAGDSKEDNVGKPLHERSTGVAFGNHPSHRHCREDKICRSNSFTKSLPRPGEHDSQWSRISSSSSAIAG